MNETRQRLLEALPRGRTRAERVRTLVGTLVTPLADRLEDDDSYVLRLLDQVLSLRDRDDKLRFPQDTPSNVTGAHAYELLRAEVAELDDESSELRLRLALTLMARALADREGLEHAPNPPSLPPRARFVEELVDAMTAIVLRGLASTPRPGAPISRRPRRS